MDANEKIRYWLTSTSTWETEDCKLISLHQGLVEIYNSEFIHDHDDVKVKKKGTSNTRTYGGNKEVSVKPVQQNCNVGSGNGKAVPHDGPRGRRVSAVDGEWYRRACLHESDWIEDESVWGKSNEGLKLEEGSLPCEEVSCMVENMPGNTQNRLHPTTKLNMEAPEGALECNICRKLCKTKQALGSHMVKHRLHECLACGTIFPKRAALARHQEVHSDRQYLCKSCGNAFETVECLQQHQLSHGSEFKCLQCHKSFRSQSDLTLHEQTRSKSPNKSECQPLTCQLCGRSFNEKKRLDDHQNFHTGKTPYECNICQKRFATRDSLCDHRRIHRPESERPNKCHLCPRGFNTQRKLLSHVRGQHQKPSKLRLKKSPKQEESLLNGAPIKKKGLNDKLQLETRFTCQLCDKSFEKEHYLKNHIAMHKSSDEAVFTCAQCHRSFKTEYHLKKHLDKHLVSHECPTCGKVAANKAALEQHMSVHFDNRPHTCETCGSSFKTMNCLRRHEKIHIGAKPFKCSYCDKAFAYRYRCKGHEATHDESLRHTCETCGRTFARSADMNRHMKVEHSLEGYPFNCDLCGKGFLTESVLNDHKNQHTGETPYECTVCAAKFSSKQGVHKHEKRHISVADSQYQCQFCAEVFHTEKELCQHVEKRHMGFTDKNEFELHCMQHIEEKREKNIKMEDI